MKPFKQSKEGDPRKEKKTPRVFELLYGAILGKQRKLADWLGRQSEKLSTRGKQVSLLLFGLLMGGVSLTLMINSIRDTSVNASVFPRAIESPISPPRVGRDPVLTPEEYNKLAAFRRMMDSLKQSPGGRALYEEILQGRTGLLDSVDFLLGITNPSRD